MKKTLITATAVATVMSASAAYADLSLGGALARQINSGDATTGISNTSTSSTINVDFTETLDNGMGMAANTDITPSGAVTNPVVIDAEPPGIFNRSALRTIVKWKYKPRILDGKAVPRPGVQHLITYELEDG